MRLWINPYGKNNKKTVGQERATDTESKSADEPKHRYRGRRQAADERGNRGQQTTGGGQGRPGKRIERQQTKEACYPSWIRTRNTWIFKDVLNSVDMNTF